MSKWSWNIGRVLGIDLEIHASFLLLLGWTALSAYREAGSGTAMLISVAFMLAVFASVVAHEYGHALTARRFGIKTQRILLLPVGGVAQLERMPRDPTQEMWVAAAGPAISFILSGVLAGVAMATGSAAPTTFIGALAWANFMLGAFNLLPAFPMDGGRIFRAWLSARLGHAPATFLAATLGKIAAVILGLVGLFTNPMLSLLAIFLYMMASMETRQLAREFHQAMGHPSDLAGSPGGHRVQSPETIHLDGYDVLPREPTPGAGGPFTRGTQQNWSRPKPSPGPSGVRLVWLRTSSRR